MNESLDKISLMSNKFPRSLKKREIKVGRLHTMLDVFLAVLAFFLILVVFGYQVEPPTKLLTSPYIS